MEYRAPLRVAANRLRLCGELFAQTLDDQSRFQHVGHEPGATLKSPDAELGGRTGDPVDRTGIEPVRAQCHLQARNLGIDACCDRTRREREDDEKERQGAGRS